MENKIDIAIEYMSENRSFKVGDLRLGANDLNEIEVAGWSNYLDLKNITKQIAFKELQEIKSIFSKMLEGSDNLKSFLIGKNIKYVLYYDDAGKASITICTEENGIIVWRGPVRD